MKLTPIFLAAGLLNVSVLATPLSQSKTPAQPAAHGSGHGSSSGNAPKGGSGSSTRGGSSSGTPTTRGPVKGTATPKGPVKSTATPKGRPSRTSSAAPARTSAEERFPKFYTCSPRDYGTKKIKTMKVDAYKAKVQAGKAGITKGKSGDPHRYYNGEGLKWDFHGCDDSLDLWEYPVFAIGDKQDAWGKDTKTNKQEETAIRAVSANMNGGAKFCGVMVHELINVPEAAQGTNAPPFIKCTPSY